MLPHPVSSCINIQIIELQVCTIIFWLVIHRVIFLEDGMLDVVNPNDVQ